MPKKELKLGETFQHENINLRVEKAKHCCIGCYFWENRINCSGAVIDKITGDCSVGRKDKTSVIFVKVEE